MQILIAEDDKTSRMILQANLKKRGYEVFVATDGQEAVDLYAKMEIPSLLILDWMMPGYTGIELVKKFKEESPDNPPYILLLTGSDKKNDLSYALNEGADDFIRKPYDVDEFWARLAVGERTLATQKKLIETQKRLLYISQHDPLTEVFSRGAILELLSKEIKRLERTGTRFSVGIFDLDYFKNINDTYGHGVGDEVLCTFTRLVKENLREYDSFGRFGGEEFLLISPENHDSETNGIFERIRNAVESSIIKVSGFDVKYTVSVGVFKVCEQTQSKLILEYADKSLYKAKAEGRNKVCFYEENSSKNQGEEV